MNGHKSAHETCLRNKTTKRPRPIKRAVKTLVNPLVGQKCEQCKAIARTSKKQCRNSAQCRINNVALCRLHFEQFKNHVPLKMISAEDAQCVSDASNLLLPPSTFFFQEKNKGKSRVQKLKSVKYMYELGLDIADRILETEQLVQLYCHKISPDEMKKATFEVFRYQKFVATHVQKCARDFFSNEHFLKEKCVLTTEKMHSTYDKMDKALREKLQSLCNAPPNTFVPSREKKEECFMEPETPEKTTKISKAAFETIRRIVLALQSALHLLYKVFGKAITYSLNIVASTYRLIGWKIVLLAMAATLGVLSPFLIKSLGMESLIGLSHYADKLCDLISNHYVALGLGAVAAHRIYIASNNTNGSKNNVTQALESWKRTYTFLSVLAPYCTFLRWLAKQGLGPEIITVKPPPPVPPPGPPLPLPQTTIIGVGKQVEKELSKKLVDVTLTPKPKPLTEESVVCPIPIFVTKNISVPAPMTAERASEVAAQVNALASQTPLPKKTDINVGAKHVESTTITSWILTTYLAQVSLWYGSGASPAGLVYMLLTWAATGVLKYGDIMNLLKFLPEGIQIPVQRHLLKAIQRGTRYVDKLPLAAAGQLAIGAAGTLATRIGRNDMRSFTKGVAWLQRVGYSNP